MQHFKVCLRTDFEYNSFNQTNVKLVKVSYWCFSPSVALTELSKNNLRSVILTSGTLTPLSSFATEFNATFPIRLENSHIVKKWQIWAGIASHGPDGGYLNSKYNLRKTPAYKKSLGLFIASVIKVYITSILIFSKFQMVYWYFSLHMMLYLNVQKV